ncbi:ribulose-bisphosphate carboxylase large chain [Geothermobacter ehrlichii]|uniref:Ribulose-bisphosphate carboxylase large chain n=1 Tax=Geothermobacter ehrlichii TaxID=213224 RepID=A0A5D3WLB0_9BACT|nr:RuBisCO large subunit C-terminal-like domain-containing protein [Geothermobacter ehrlichii]TYO98914.1 ribulose-bisphosphate carboxylase large chain [Geothermobacter ehrlichii]
MTTASDRFWVDYRITVRDGRSIEDHARDICIEQTVEVPPEVIPDTHGELGLIGRVESCRPVVDRANVWQVRISYRLDVTGFSLPQLLNVLFGNISLKNNILVSGLQYPEGLLEHLPGPRFGISGLRRLLGVHGRALACTAIKPMGLPIGDFVRIATEFARGGADLIKDDHGLADQPFHPFEERVARCQEAIERVNAQTGRRCLYFPMVSGGYDRLEKQLAFAAREGVRGVMVGPMLIGLDSVRHIAREYGLAVMAHPALTGTCFHDRSHGITPAVLLGTLFRLAGADISIYPHAGGRFHLTAEECRELADALRRPEGRLQPAFPCPAGGMTLDRVPELIDFYGPDVILLIGGDILRQRDIAGAVGRFMDRLRQCGQEELSPPESGPAGACEWRSGAGPAGRVEEILRFAGYTWSDRRRQAYKAEDEADFKGVSRQELTGKFGERTAFDLRYFEIEPGGWSSREKHVHEHVIIGVRGRGLLCKQTKEIPIGINDVAYIAPLEVHQLRNPGDEPFGFYCIVDHKRDRPQPA